MDELLAALKTFMLGAFLDEFLRQLGFTTDQDLAEKLDHINTTTENDFSRDALTNTKVDSVQNDLGKILTWIAGFPIGTSPTDGTPPTTTPGENYDDTPLREWLNDQFFQVNVNIVKVWNKLLDMTGGSDLPSAPVVIDASDVWDHNIERQVAVGVTVPYPAGLTLGQLPTMQEALAPTMGIPMDYLLDFGLYCSDWTWLRGMWNGLHTPLANPQPPVVDWTKWNGSDDMLTFLNGEYGSLHWVVLSASTNHQDAVGYYLATSDVVAYVYCTRTTHDLPWLSGRMYSPHPASWPGLSNVTLGTPVALADGATIPGPLDGLLVEITSVPAGTGRYAYDGLYSYTHVCSVVFGGADNETERAQTLGLQLETVTPKTIVRPSVAVIRLERAISGTATPWVSIYTP